MSTEQAELREALDRYFNPPKSKIKYNRDDFVILSGNQPSLILAEDRAALERAAKAYLSILDGSMVVVPRCAPKSVREQKIALSFDKQTAEIFGLKIVNDPFGFMKRVDLILSPQQLSDIYSRSISAWEKQHENT